MIKPDRLCVTDADSLCVRNISSNILLKRHPAGTIICQTQPSRLLTMRNLGGFFLPAFRGFPVAEVYMKSPLTFEQQLQQLKERGLIIMSDEDFQRLLQAELVARKKPQ